MPILAIIEGGQEAYVRECKSIAAAKQMCGRLVRKGGWLRKHMAFVFDTDAMKVYGRIPRAGWIEYLSGHNEVCAHGFNEYMEGNQK